MRRLFLMAILASMTMPLMAQHIHVSTVNTSLVLDARQGGSLRFVYYGQRLNDPEQSRPPHTPPAACRSTR